MRFLRTESLDYVRVSEVRRIVRCQGGRWTLLGEDDRLLGTMKAEFRPESLNERYVAAAAGSTCLVVCRDDDAGEVFAMTQPVVAWRVSREMGSPSAGPVMVESPGSNAVIVAVPMADGRWCEPGMKIHASRDALMAEALRRVAAASAADPPACPQQEEFV